MFIGQFFNQNLNFGVFERQGVISRVQEHLVTKNPLTLIKEEANPCSRNTEIMHMYTCPGHNRPATGPDTSNSVDRINRLPDIRCYFVPG